MSASVSNSSASPSKPRLTLPQRLQAIRERLIESGFYLGHRSLRDNVAWVKVGKSNKLAVKLSIPSAAELAAAADSGLATPPASTPEPELATIAAVALISDSDFYMVSDAGYRGPGKFDTKFADIKPTCTGGKPDIEPFAADFGEVAENARWLMAETATANFTQKQGFFVGTNAVPKIKVRHVLFEPVDPSPTGDASDDTLDDDNEGGPIPWTIDRWPVVTEEAKTGLADIVKTHRVLPIPAYDMHGDLIDPHFYRSRLCGAIVEMHFELTHWSMRGRNEESGRDTYTADVSALRVLVPPKAISVTPKKRKAVAKMDPMESPSKKSRGVRK